MIMLNGYILILEIVSKMRYSYKDVLGKTPDFNGMIFAIHYI